MKRVRNVLVLTSLLPLAAWSQSGVSVSGVVDLGVRSVDNEGRGSVRSVVSGANSTSKLIIRGTEDLGGGLGAGFYLEHGFAADTGSPASATMFWDRRATVSLIRKSLGEIRAGREYVPTYSNWGRYDPFLYVGVAASANLISSAALGPIRSAFSTNPNTTVRSNNLVQFHLPGGLGGLEGSIMAAASEGAAPASGNYRLGGLRLGYANKQFGLAAAAATTRVAVGGSFKDQNISGFYQLGTVRLSGSWRQFKHATSRQTNLLLGAVIPAGSGNVRVSYGHVDLSGQVGGVSIDANGANQIGLGYVHDLSKRTALYGTVARIDNKGAATFAVSGGAPGMAGGSHSTGYEVGLRHAF